MNNICLGGNKPFIFYSVLLYALFMISKVEEIRQAISGLCAKTGIEYTYFLNIFGCQIENPESFDILFHIPFNIISEPEKKKRIDILTEFLNT